MVHELRAWNANKDCRLPLFCVLILFSSCLPVALVWASVAHTGAKTAPSPTQHEVFHSQCSFGEACAVSDAEQQTYPAGAVERFPPCSLSVSQWVLQAWNIVIENAQNDLHLLHAQDYVSRTCPFYYIPHVGFLNSLSENDLRPKGITRRQVPGLPYRCNRCSQIFETAKLFNHHIEMEHSQNSNMPETVVSVPMPILSSPPKVCLEQYCTVFDVCDKPPTAGSPISFNEKAVIGAQPRRRMTTEDFLLSEANRTARGAAPFQKSPRREQHTMDCSHSSLNKAFSMCNQLLSNCFALTRASKEVKHLHIYFRHHLCGALSSCERYQNRRRYAGLPNQFTDAAYRGLLTLSYPGLSSSTILGIVLGSTLIVLVLLASTCRVLESLDEPQAERHGYRVMRETRKDVLVSVGQCSKSTFRARKTSPQCAWMVWRRFPY